MCLFLSKGQNGRFIAAYLSVQKLENEISEPVSDSYSALCTYISR